MYGMNFSDMPELHSHFGYPAALAVTLVICFVMWWRLKSGLAVSVMACALSPDAQAGRFQPEIATPISLNARWQ